MPRTIMEGKARKREEKAYVVDHEEEQGDGHNHSHNPQPRIIEHAVCNHGREK